MYSVFSSVFHNSSIDLAIAMMMTIEIDKNDDDDYYNDDN
jgi:hypothetical protein